MDFEREKDSERMLSARRMGFARAQPILRFRQGYAIGTMPLHHWVRLVPVSTSYLRTKVSLPSCPTRNTERDAGMIFILSPWRTAIGTRLPATRMLPLASNENVRVWAPCA